MPQDIYDNPNLETTSHIVMEKEEAIKVFRNILCDILEYDSPHEIDDSIVSDFLDEISSSSSSSLSFEDFCRLFQNTFTT